MPEDELAGWHHQCNGHELGQTPGDGEGEGSLACCSPQGVGKDLATEQQQVVTTYSRECQVWGKGLLFGLIDKISEKKNLLQLHWLC